MRAPILFTAVLGLLVAGRSAHAECYGGKHLEQVIGVASDGTTVIRTFEDVEAGGFTQTTFHVLGPDAKERAAFERCEGECEGGERPAIWVSRGEPALLAQVTVSDTTGDAQVEKALRAALALKRPDRGKKLVVRDADDDGEYQDLRDGPLTLFSVHSTMAYEIQRPLRFHATLAAPPASPFAYLTYGYRDRCTAGESYVGRTVVENVILVPPARREAAAAVARGLRALRKRPADAAKELTRALTLEPRDRTALRLLATALFAAKVPWAEAKVTLDGLPIVRATPWQPCSGLATFPNYDDVWEDYGDWLSARLDALGCDAR